MLKQNTRPAVKKISALVNHKSHVQKKYISLMLVPSYSTGKTRSIRIPRSIFYFIIISVITVSAVILGFYLRSNHFMQMAQNFSESLDQAHDAYNELQTSSELEQNRLLDDSNQIKSQLTEEQQRFQLEKNKQQRDYQDTLIDLQEQVDELERQLRRLDETRQEVLNQLGASAYIPPVQSLVKEIGQTQFALLGGLQELQITIDERSAYVQVSENELMDYFTVLNARIEAASLLFTDLQDVIRRAVPYINNYPTIKPVAGAIGSGFGSRRNPMGGRSSEYHDGIDISCKSGTSIKATGGGKVSFAGYHGSYGNMVIIDHISGIQTVYAHNSKLLVKVGQKVERGEIIAKSGSTGRSTGPHLHYEVRQNGKCVDPEKYFLI